MWKAGCYCGLVENVSVESGLFLWSYGKRVCGKRVVSVVLWETRVWKVSCFCGLVGNLSMESELFLWSCGKLECGK